MIKYFFALILCTASVPKLAHDFHVSILLVDHNEKTNALECSFKIFIDDLEDGLVANGAPKLYLKSDKEHTKANDYIEKYLNYHFKLDVDGQEIQYRLIGKEYEDDVCWIYVEGLNIKEFQAISIRNTILFNTFDDQVNMIHVTANNETKSIVLSKGTPRGKIHF